MRIMAWLKAMVFGLFLLAFGGYAVFSSDWFQKAFIYPFPYQELVYQYAVTHELNPYLVAGVIRAESKFNTRARSPKGASGLMQLMPDTAQWIAEQLGIHTVSQADLYEPDLNIRFGTWYLASLSKEFKDNEVLILAAYNGGRGNVNQWMNEYGWQHSFQDISKIPFRETKEYVGKVLRDKQRYQELYGSSW